jgi:hypothetical protein
MAFVASPWELVPVDLGLCSVSLSCYGSSKGACSLWLIMYILMYCWSPACTASLSCYFWSKHFLHLIQKKRVKKEQSSHARERIKREMLSSHGANSLGSAGGFWSLIIPWFPFFPHFDLSPSSILPPDSTFSSVPSWFFFSRLSFNSNGQN